MGKRFDPRKKDQLLTPERVASLKPDELLRSFGLKEGDYLADVGCGPGFFTFPAAAIVGPTGRIVAADVQSEMIAAVMAHSAEGDLRNVEIVKASDLEVPLERNRFDMILLAFVLPELTQRAVFLHRLRRALRPEGHLVVLEGGDTDTETTTTANPSLSREEVLDDLRSSGYRIAEQRAISEEYYALLGMRA